MRRLFLAMAWVAACGGGGNSRGSLDDASTDATTDGGLEGGLDDAQPSDSGVRDAGVDGEGDAGMDGCVLEGVRGQCTDPTTCEAMSNHISTPGLCAGNAGCCTPFGLALCDPHAMPRPDPNAGKVTEEPGTGGCPPGMIAVSTFCVDKYEATLVRIDTGATWCPFDNPGTTPVRAISVAGTVPQAYISGIQAAAACTKAGKRLCTDAEWLRACQGPDGGTYPYGNTDTVGVCNDHRAEHPAVEYFGTTDAAIWTMLDNPCLDQLPETVDPTGSLTGCVTAEGAYDMMGNLHEWTANPSGAFRGGYYVDTVNNGPGCLYVTTAHAPSYWDYSTGFRCCAH
jgi:hypothetical protein